MTFSSDDKKFQECFRFKKNIETEILKYFGVEATACKTGLKNFIVIAKKHFNKTSKETNEYKVLYDE